MPIVDSKFKPAKFMHNAHFQTMYPYLFRKVKNVSFKRERLELKDNDFVDIDIVDNQSNELIILSHGLEGSSDTSYIRGMAKIFSDNEQKDVFAWNMRSCSGELNRKETFYHGAQVEDLHEVIEYALKYKQYKKISLIGFSLGGNLTAFYLASMKSRIPSQVQSAVLFSSPIDLKACVYKLQTSSMGHIYVQNFLKTMKQKIHQKHKMNMLQQLDMKAISKVKTFLEFDGLVTAPLAGYKTADEYYNYASATHIIDQIQIPVLLVQAKNDPFLAEGSFPFQVARNKKNIFLEIPPSGGHLGFLNFDQGMDFWAERRAAEFIRLNN